MKQFISKVIYFFLFLYALAYLFDVIISNYIKKTNLYQGEVEVWNDIYNSKINSDLLILGSSRAWVQVNPKIIFKKTGIKVYNLGMDGHKFDLTYLRFLEYIKYNKKPKYIVLMVDVNFFSFNKKLYNYEQFLPYMLFNYNYYNYLKHYSFFKKLDFFIPFIRYSGKENVLKESVNNCFSKSKINNYRVNGFKAQDKVWCDLKLKKHSEIVKLDSYRLKYLNSFKKYCLKNKIKLFFVYPPEYIDGQLAFKNRSEIVSYLTSYAALNHIPYYDYSQNKHFMYNKSLFYNAFHLNKLGEIKFTNILVNDLFK